MGPAIIAWSCEPALMMQRSGAQELARQIEELV